MKKTALFLMLAAAAAAFSSCNRELEAPAPSPEAKGIQISITASFPETKTYMEGNTPYWYDGDVIGVVKTSDLGGGMWTLDESDIPDGGHAKTATFTGYLDEAPESYYAFYPNTNYATADFPYIDFSKEQTIPFKGSVDPKADILFSDSFSVDENDVSLDNLTFHRMVAYLRVAITLDEGVTADLSSEHIKKVTVTTDKESLVNDVELDLDNMVLIPQGLASKSVTAIDGNYIVGDGSTMLAILPVNLAAGDVLTITAETEHYKITKSKTLTAPVSISAGDVQPLNLKATDAEITEKVLTVERLWGKYPVAAGKPWTSEYASTIAKYVIGNDRTVAADDKYVYVAAASSTTKGILAINLTNPSDIHEVNINGVEGGFFATACVRTIYNPSTGKYILLAGTLAHDSDCNFKVYAWADGIENAPSVLINWNTNNGSPRRIGDFFTVSGDWSNGEIWVRLNKAGTASTTFKWNITNGVAGTVLGGQMGYAGASGLGSVYKYNVSAKQALLVTPSIGRFFNYADNAGWLSVDNDGVNYAGIDNSVMARKFGITPFEYNGKKYIAYVKKGMYNNDGNAARARLKIIEDQGSAETFLASMEADNVLFEFPIQNSNNATTEAEFNEVYFTDDPSTASQEMANCSVVVREDGVYIVGHLFNVGLSVFKMYLK